MTDVDCVVDCTQNLDVAPQCQFFVIRKKRLCRMTVRPGRSYCGEHEPRPQTPAGQDDTRIPCPLDPKHTCYASKLAKHVAICNARAQPPPAHEVAGVNAPARPARCDRLPLALVPPETLARVIRKVNTLYEQLVKDNIEEFAERPIHPAVAAEWAQADRGTGSRRHLQQASALLHLAQAEGLVRDGACYVELGAGKGQLSCYVWAAWGRSAAGLLLVDRAALRHKRDNRLRGSADEVRDSSVVRLRADLAHLALERVPLVAASGAVVGLAKHLCGVATDYALRCMSAEALADRTRGLVLATCCHHRCAAAQYVALERLQELDISEEELNVMLGVVSWATCGDGRSRQRRAEGSAEAEGAEAGARQSRCLAGRRAKALLDWGRAEFLRRRGFRAHLVRFVPEHVSPENICIVAEAMPNESGVRR